MGKQKPKPSKGGAGKTTAHSTSSSKLEQVIKEDIHREMHHLEDDVIGQRKELNKEAEDEKAVEFAAALRTAVIKAREEERRRLGFKVGKTIHGEVSPEVIESIRNALERDLREEIRKEMEQEEKKIISDLKEVNPELEQERTNEMVKVMKRDLHERKRSYNRKHPGSPI